MHNRDGILTSVEENSVTNILFVRYLNWNITSILFEMPSGSVQK